MSKVAINTTHLLFQDVEKIFYYIKPGIIYNNSFKEGQKVDDKTMG